MNSRTYHRHPNFVVNLTMNPGYAGTEPLNVALKNRFAKVNVPALTKDEFIRRARCYSKGLGHELSDEFFSKLFDFAETIEKQGCSTQWHENIKFSIRNAQRLCDSILAKSRSFEDFFAALSVQYLNDLATDNDNSEKLEILKKSQDIINQAKTIYHCYDFATIQSKKVERSFSSFFTEEEDNTASKSGAKAKSMMDDILKRFES